MWDDLTTEKGKKASFYALTEVISF
jgi:hypothetical protein